MFALQFSTTVLDKPFLILSQKLHILFPRNCFILHRKILRQRNSQIRVQPSIQPFRKRIGKYLFHPFIAEIAGAESVAMPNQEFFSVELEFLWFMVHRDI